MPRAKPPEPAKAAKAARKPTDQTEPNSEHEDCCEAAWQALNEGVFTLRGIARWIEARTGHTHTHNWVKAALARHSKLVESTVDDGAISARAQYLQGLYTDLVAQNVLAKGAEKEADRIRARREMTEIRAKIAAAQGVVTQRAAHEVTGKDGSAVQVEAKHSGRLELKGDEALAVVQFHAARRKPQVDEVHSPGADGATGDLSEPE